MNKIHPTAIIEGDIKLGTGNEILPYTVLTGPLEIGNGNRIGPHVVIGSPGADTKNPRHDSSEMPIRMGNNNIIREFVGIQKPCYKNVTPIGNNTYLMQGSSISHDVILEDKVVLAALVAIAGLSHIMEGANLGMGATIHQYTVVGAYSIVATGSAVIKNVKPFSRYIPGHPISVNQYAIDKFGFSQYSAEIHNYVMRNLLPTSPPVAMLVEKYLQLHQDSKRREY